jgi:hypothetical protein
MPLHERVAGACFVVSRVVVGATVGASVGFAFVVGLTVVWVPVRATLGQASQKTGHSITISSMLQNGFV